MTTPEDLKRFRELIDAASSNVQYGLISGRTVEEHADDFRESLSKGKIGADGKVDLWGVYLKDTSIPVCHTGNGPTSEANARLIEFLFNSATFIFDELERLYAMAEVHETNLQRLERLAKEHPNG